MRGEGKWERGGEGREEERDEREGRWERGGGGRRREIRGKRKEESFNTQALQSAQKDSSMLH